MLRAVFKKPYTPIPGAREVLLDDIRRGPADIAADAGYILASFCMTAESFLEYRSRFQREPLAVEDDALAGIKEYIMAAVRANGMGVDLKEWTVPYNVTNFLNYAINDAFRFYGDMAVPVFIEDRSDDYAEITESFYSVFSAMRATAPTVWFLLVVSTREVPPNRARPLFLPVSTGAAKSRPGMPSIMRYNDTAYTELAREDFLRTDGLEKLLGE